MPRPPASATGPRVAGPRRPTRRKKTSGLPRLLGFVLNLVLILGVLGAGLGSGFAYGLLERFSTDLPRLEMLADYAPSELTTVYSRDGKVIDRFFLENRVVVPLSDVPQNLKNAIFAIEDVRFYEHHGIDVKGMVRAMVKNVMAGRIVEGASTITQQLVRTMFLSRERVFARKLKEMILAWRLEERLTKDQILEMYFNEIYLGSGAYGVEAASRTYFGKSVSELTLGECAILASLPKAPENYSPKSNPRKAKQRQKTVLDKMAEDGFITRAEADEAYRAPLQLKSGGPAEPAALYFVEHVRQRVERQLGSDTVHRGGLDIHTTLDLEFQRLAEKALRDGLRTYDKRHGYRGAIVPGARIVDLATSIAPGARLLATVKNTEAKTIDVEVLTSSSGKRPDGEAPPEEITRTAGVIDVPSMRQHWIGKVAEKLHKDDLILVEVDSVPEGGAPLKVHLEQEPEVEGGLMCINPMTGEVLAMVGGYDFSKSEFNRAIQAKRQPGSSFKLFIYLTALEQGLTAATPVYDTAIVEQQGGEDGKVWKPRNYYNKFFGKTTLRVALEKSYNPVAVKLLEGAGIQPVIRNARRLGLSSDLSPDLSLGLGSSGVSLLEMTAAYGTMAAQGLYARPYFVSRIEGRDGEVLDEQVPQVRQAFTPDLSYVMTRLLQGVIQNGTGKPARKLQRPIAGKTGTTNEHHDAWFLGFSPQIATGVWVGYDNMQRSLGKGETGAQAALPIWTEFMEGALKRFEPTPFPVPEGVVQANIDPTSGLLATPQCHKVIVETFVAGTVPTRYCDQHAISLANFDQLDTAEVADAAAAGAPDEPVKVVDPSEITVPKAGEKDEDEEDH